MPAYLLNLDWAVRFGLTRREAEILLLIADDVPPSEIAGVLTVSAATVRGHTMALRQKLGAPSRAQLLIKALEAGVLVASN